MDQAIKDAAAALVDAINDAGLATPRRVSIDLQANGQHPIRIEVADDDFNVVGVAITPPLSE